MIELTDPRLDLHKALTVVEDFAPMLSAVQELSTENVDAWLATQASVDVAMLGVTLVSLIDSKVGILVFVVEGITPETVDGLLDAAHATLISRGLTTPSLVAAMLEKELDDA